MLIKSSKKNQKGSMLIESLIATLIFSVGVLSLVGLQTALTKNSSDNQYRTQALQIAQMHMTQIISYGQGASTYINAAKDDAQTSVAEQLPNGKINFPPIDLDLAQVTVSWQLPGGKEHSVTSSAYLYDGVTDD